MKEQTKFNNTGTLLATTTTYLRGKVNNIVRKDKIYSIHTTGAFI